MNQKKSDPETAKTETAKSFTPNELLALEVVGAFRAAHYLRPEDLTRLERGLQGGSLKAEDWTSFAENALQSEQALEKEVR